MRIGLAALLAALALAATAFAEEGFLSRDEARAELLGVELIGVEEVTGLSWRECIEPQGRTSYLRPGAPPQGPRDEGRLAISDDGQLCFSYRSSNFARASCYRGRREGADNYRFISADGGRLVFVTHAVRRGVRSCNPADAPIS
jgi:hypothetical protein